MKSSRSSWPPLSAVPLPEGDVSHGITCGQGLGKGWQKGVSQWWGFCCCKLRQIMVAKMLLSHWLWRQQKNDEGVKFARGKIFSGFETQLRKGLMVNRHFFHVEEKENPKKENENTFNLNRASKGQRAPKLLLLPCHFVTIRKEVSTMVQFTEIGFLYKCGELKTGQTQSLFWVPGRALLCVSPSASVPQTTWNSFQNFQQSRAHQHQLHSELGGSSPQRALRETTHRRSPAPEQRAACASRRTC